MKLFFLIIIFGLICAGCSEGPRMTAEVGEIRNGKLVKSNSEVTLTHRADDDEKVRISYENTKNGKKVKDFEIRPEQCIILKKEQIQFVTNIMVGRGFGEAFSAGYRPLCGSGDDSNMSYRIFACNVVLDNGSYEVIDTAPLWMFDAYSLQLSKRNTSPACQYFEDLL